MCTTSLLHTVETHAIGERTLTAYRLIVPSVAFATCQLYMISPLSSIFYIILHWFKKSIPDSRRPACLCPGFFSHSALIQLKLPRIELIIFPLLRNQLVMAAALDDLAVFEHHDRIRIAYS